MRVLVVFCHPSKESFQSSILVALTERLRSAGHTVRIIDLYAEGFAAVLDAEAWRAHRQDRRHPAPDLEAHVAALGEADGLVLVYPTWWYGLPAMLKGWFDRVWQPGVAFTLEGGVFRTNTLANIKRFLAVLTTPMARRKLLLFEVDRRRSGAQATDARPFPAVRPQCQAALDGDLRRRRQEPGTARAGSCTPSRGAGRSPSCSTDQAGSYGQLGHRRRIDELAERRALARCPTGSTE